MNQKASQAAGGRGITLFEVMVSVAILGFILLLIGVEFDSSIENLLHTRSNRDNEANSRLVMTKIVDRLRAASPLISALPGSPVILNPVPTSSPGATGTVLQFYRVRPGSLANPNAIPTSGPGGGPSPPYDVVTIQRGPCTLWNPSCTDPSPNYLVETAVDAVSNTQTEALVLGRDVTAFSVTALAGPSNGAASVDISLTVISPTSRCQPTCSYTSNSSVFIGGSTVANQ